MDFPLEYHYLDEKHPRYQMPYHWHEEYEILHIRTGEFELTLGDDVFTMHPGDVAFISAGQLHGGVPRDCTYECVVFDIRLLLTGSDLCKQQISAVRHHRLAIKSYFPAGNKVIRHTIPPMFDALRSQCTGHELITLGCLLQFFGECYKFGAYHPASPEDGSERKVLQLKKVFELIESDYASHLTLDDLSSAVHMTPKYFCRFFRQATHRTPIDYLNYYRIEVACNQIAVTDKTLTEIALDTGFSNQNYFIRLFRKYKGITPGQYLASMRPSA